MDRTRGLTVRGGMWVWASALGGPDCCKRGGVSDSWAWGSVWRFPGGTFEIPEAIFPTRMACPRSLAL